MSGDIPGNEKAEELHKGADTSPSKLNFSDVMKPGDDHKAILAMSNPKNAELALLIQNPKDDGDLLDRVTRDAEKRLPLYHEKLQQDERAGLQGTWQYGHDLLNLALNEELSEHTPDALKHYKQALDIMIKQLPSQPDQKEKAATLVNAVTSYGRVVTDPRDLDRFVGKEEQQKLHAEYKAIFEKVAKFADEPSIATYDRSEFFHVAGENLVTVAKENFNSKPDLDVIQNDLRPAIDSLTRAAKLADKTPLGQTRRLEILGSLANAELRRSIYGNFGKGEDRINSEKHIEEYLKLHREISPDRAPDINLDIKCALMLREYSQLLRTHNEDAKAVKIEQEIEKLQRRHAPQNKGNFDLA